MEEELDPQDTAVLSDDMAEPAVEQCEVKVKSVYSGLIEIAKTHGKLYRTNGKRADMLRFDLTSHAVFVGNTFLVNRGKVTMPVLETASTKIDLTGLPWLTDEERKLDPTDLFYDHYYSRPNGSEKFMWSNFPAKPLDEMTDDEVAQGLPRSEARIRLEAWILCASLDGTLEHYVTRQDTWKDGNWWWSPNPAGQTDTQLVIKTDWWKRAGVDGWVLKTGPDGFQALSTAGGAHLATLMHAVADDEARALQMVPRLVPAAKALSDAAVKLQLRAKCFDLDPLVTELNRILDYIQTGRMRQI